MTGEAKSWPSELDRREAEAAGTRAPVKFDPLAHWRALPPEIQERLGTAAAIVAYARKASVYVDDRTGLGFETAEFHADTVLQEAAADIEFAEDERPPLPDLSKLGIRACRMCGCTDQCGCPEGCSWVAADVCSSCDDRIGT
jgi:hypothetical protein